MPPAEAATVPRPVGAAVGPAPALRLAIVATHPIQYHAPLYRAIAATRDVDLTVYYAHRPSAAEQGIGFGVPFHWDDDLLSGYRSEWLRNVADEQRARVGRPFADRYADYDAPEIERIIGEQRFDVVLLHGWRVRSDWQTLRACRAHGVPVLVRGDSQLRDDAVPKRWLKRVLYPRLLRRFAACLSTGQRSEAYFRYYGATRVVRSPHFVDNRLFADRASRALRRREERRKAWGISPGDLVLLFAGKLVPRKRPLDLVHAARGLSGVHILYAGDGALRESCEAWATRTGVAVTFAGFLNQSTMPEAYVAADVLVLPSSERETWGLVVNEAMACGRPAIVSDAVGCAPDLIRDGETGYSYPAGDVAQLRTRIRQFLDARPDAERLGAAARRHVEGQFTSEAATAGVLHAARAAAGRGAWS